MQNALVLCATMSDVRPLAAILRSVNQGDHGLSKAALTFLPVGVKVTVEYKQILLLSAYVYSTLFDSFVLAPTPADTKDKPPPTIEINLNVMLQSLDIYGGSGLVAPLPRDQEVTALCLTWRGHGFPLSLQLTMAGSSSTTLCKLNTSEWESHMDPPFETHEVQVRIIMKSAWLSDALSELGPGYEKIILICQPEPDEQRARCEHRVLRLKAVSNEGATTFDYPEVKDVIENAEILGVAALEISYRYHLFAKALPALRNSLMVSLRIGEDGLLRMQFLMPARPSHLDGKTVENYVEFTCPALLEDWY